LQLTGIDEDVGLNDIAVGPTV